MRFILLTLTCIFYFLTSNAQDTYADDLSSLKLNLENTRSFKKQIKGRKKIAFEKLYDSLHRVKPADRLQHIILLSELLYPVNDQHLALYEQPDSRAFSNEESFKNYLSGEEFRQYPALKINTDSLENILKTYPPDSLQGIYYFGDMYTAGLMKTAPDTYLGVVLRSSVPHWLPGHIAFRLHSEDGIHGRAVYAHPYYKSYTANANEKFRNRSLINSGFYISGKYFTYNKQKEQSADDYVNLPVNGHKFSHTRLNDSMHYLVIRSFQRNTETSRQSALFYEQVKDSLSLPYLLIDLRNNEGGSALEMRKFVRLVKKFKGKVYVLVNNGTLSQAEIYTLKLMRLKKVTLAGQPTKGMLTYGSNYGRKVVLAGGKHIFYPTDMGGRKKYLRYERRGIVPDIILDEKSPWTSQVTDHIRKRREL